MRVAQVPEPVSTKCAPSFLYSRHLQVESVGRTGVRVNLNPYAFLCFYCRQLQLESLGRSGHRIRCIVSAALKNIYIYIYIHIYIYTHAHINIHREMHLLHHRRVDLTLPAPQAELPPAHSSRLHATAFTS